MSGITVAIVGAGIGGLAGAAALRRRGVEVEVFEQAAELGEVGAGVAIAVNGWRLLEHLGVIDRLEARSSSLDNGYYQLREDGSHIATIRSPGADGRMRVFGVHRADLIEVLRTVVPDSVIHTGHRLTGLVQDDTGVDLSFENGASFRADAVIGADGIHSAVRPHLVDEAPPVSSGQAAYRALVPVTSEDMWEWGASKIWIGPGRHFLVYPVRADRLLNIVAVVPALGGERDSWSAPGDPRELANEFAGWDPVVGSLIERVQDTFLWGLFDRAQLPAWTDRRVALLGDAAHSMLPHLGQGANQTIEDGFALAAALEGVDSAGVAAALAVYEDLRYGRASTVQRASREFGNLFDMVERGRFEDRDETIRRTAPFYAWLNSHDADSLIPPEPAPAR